MVNLFDILSGIPKRQEFGRLNNRVIEALELLVNTDSPESYQGESRIDLYLNNLNQYLKGVEDGYKDSVKQVNVPFYLIGAAEGIKLRKDLEKARSKNYNDAVESYTWAYEQLKGVVSALIEEISSFEQARHDPYKFFLYEMPRVAMQNKPTRDGLLKILNLHKDVVKNFLYETTGINTDEEVEQKEYSPFDSYVRAGLAHLLKGDIEHAQRQFLLASTKEPKNELIPLVKNVSHNIYLAGEILSKAYSRYKRALEFDSSVKQVSQ